MKLNVKETSLWDKARDKECLAVKLCLFHLRTIFFLLVQQPHLSFSLLSQHTVKCICLSLPHFCLLLVICLCWINLDKPMCWTFMYYCAIHLDWDRSWCSQRLQWCKLQKKKKSIILLKCFQKKKQNLNKPKYRHVYVGNSSKTLKKYKVLGLK